MSDDYKFSHFYDRENGEVKNENHRLSLVVLL